MEKAAILVAGGRGTRMGAQISKQYLPIGGRPVLMHTLEAFFQADPNIQLVLVLPKDDFGFWRNLCEEYRFDLKHQVVAGGESRFQSVRNGLQAITFDKGLVAIHDGVRPFVNQEVIRESFAQAERTGSAIAVVTLKDSLREVTEEGLSFFRERHRYRLVQTPQTFQLEKIKKAFQTPERTEFTDDATVYEFQGWQVTLIDGNPENIKLTTPEDLNYAEYLLSRRK
ncbi:2-C-methyl-D-erythritol 4-phosphate cytidylyltransferase [Algoriphagus sp. AK58]|uniref:2-C-methyl-D-erythritol 4-phosphate cytidylyltransferase n=1 Tax=Algoriphagus sp. AK58 TaxID=1406877 RepID=UPI0016509E39|nr:2-C-methyl-D-erythritol 4-phosphate cytidylyltransferase [Algoriphagus sp. AK58]MBC6368119.1 2-C-methyl-D-erythritol 4-phosphate cytidylyltransferase [Algoriphagus sp. AK58]